MLIIPIFVILQTTTFATPQRSTIARSTEAPSGKDIPALLAKKSGVFDLRYSADVHQHIQDYTSGGRRTTERILGRADLYFPIIEDYLQRRGLPDELKYLTVIESALNPRARSGAGAVGLWQLIPSTARRYGLRIDHQVDERRDPHKSTEAALRYLTFLHGLFDDWTLAVAAYNCGGGAVQKAIRQANSKDFYKVKDFLPSQTQHYIDRLAGAVYVMNYHHLYRIQPVENDYALQFTQVAKVYSEVRLPQISRALDIPLTTLRRLNPSYVQSILPTNRTGNYLILPKHKMDSFLNYYESVVASGYDRPGTEPRLIALN